MDVRVDINKIEHLNLPEHMPPPLHQIALLHGGDPMPEEVQVIMHQDALTQVDVHGRSDLQVELGGVLLGSAYRHNGRIFVEIAAALPAASKENGPVHFTFTADAWAQIHRDRADKYPDLHIVGWFHTHPDLGVFYSADDEVVHSAAFTMPWHVGLVLDPVRREACFFGWTENRYVVDGLCLQPIRGYYELADRQPESIIDWRVTYRSGLGAMRQAAFVQDIKTSFGFGGRPETSDAIFYASDPALMGLDRRSLMLSGAAVILGIVLLLTAVWSINRRANNLETAVLALASEQMSESNRLGTAACAEPTIQIFVPIAGQAAVVGDKVQLFGVADSVNVGTYQIDVRRTDEARWQLIDDFRWSRSLENLGTWNTMGFAPGQYKVRLTAVDRVSNIPMQDMVCVIDMTLLPAPTPIPTSVPTAEAPQPAEAPEPSDT